MNQPIIFYLEEYMFYFILFALLPRPAVVNFWFKQKPTHYRSMYSECYSFRGGYSVWYYNTRSKCILWHLKNIRDMSASYNWHLEKLKEIDPSNTIFTTRCDTRAEAKKQVHSYENDVVPQMELD